MTSTPAADDRIEVRSSRLWALFHFSFTRWVFPARLVADHIGVSTNIVLFWLTPWRRTDEHLPMSHIAEVTHIRCEEAFTPVFDALWRRSNIASRSLSSWGRPLRAGPVGSQ